MKLLISGSHTRGNRGDGVIPPGFIGFAMSLQAYHALIQPDGWFFVSLSQSEQALCGLGPSVLAGIKEAK